LFRSEENNKSYEILINEPAQEENLPESLVKLLVLVFYKQLKLALLSLIESENSFSEKEKELLLLEKITKEMGLMFPALVSNDLPVGVIQKNI